MSVSAIFRRHEDGYEDLSTFADWDVIDPLLDESAAMQKVIDQTAKRILLHLEVRQGDEDALRDVIFLTLGEGGWLVRLQELWWGDKTKRRDRLLQLTRQIDFMDGGGVQPEARQCLIKNWMQRPHALLPNVVDRAISLINSRRDEVASDLSSLRDWLQTYASFALWGETSLALQARLQTSLIQLVNPTLTPFDDARPTIYS
jgi:hypothetical protein